MRTTRLIIAGLLLAVTATACSSGSGSEPADTGTSERYFTVNPERAFVVDPRNGIGDFDVIEWCSHRLAYTTTRLHDAGSHADAVAISTVRVPERDADCGAGKS